MPSTHTQEQGQTYLLVRLIGALRVADLAQEVVLLVKDKVADTRQVRELGVCGSSERAARAGSSRSARRGCNVPVSTFIFTTPFLTAVLISSLVEPEPPWKTRKL